MVRIGAGEHFEMRPFAPFSLLDVFVSRFGDFYRRRLQSGLPWLIDARTRLFDQITPGHIEYMLGKIPRARFVKLEEIASMAAWLVSEENSHTTAATFDLSGGRATY
jgi:NAD(P)-dependent dehydrogenase (short-subunit alcohol dehydrogenase family)